MFSVRMPRFIAVWRRNMTVWRKNALRSLLGSFMEPLTTLLALGWGLGVLVGEVEHMSYLAFLSSGILVMSAMNTATFEGLYLAYTRMEVQRTWDGMLAAPLCLTDIVLGEIFWMGTKSLISNSA
ncbi:MAG: nodulation protein NodJ, partial [Methylococcaceae bacterium]